jgi:hypothetical protein
VLLEPHGLAALEQCHKQQAVVVGVRTGPGVLNLRRVDAKGGAEALLVVVTLALPRENRHSRTTAGAPAAQSSLATGSGTTTWP